MKDVAFIIIITSVMTRETFFTLPCRAPRLLFRLALDIMFGMPRTFCTFNCLSSVRSWVATFKNDPSRSVRWTTKSTLHLVFFLLFPTVCAALSHHLSCKCCGVQWAVHLYSVITVICLNEFNVCVCTCICVCVFSCATKSTVDVNSHFFSHPSLRQACMTVCTP